MSDRVKERLSEDTETFLAVVATGYRITIYEPIRKSLRIKIGDHLRLTVQIERKKDDEVVMLPCGSGIHEPEDVPHMRRNLGRGWARYTCMICKKATPMKISKAEGK